MTDALTQRATALLGQLDLDEKLHVLSGDLPVVRGLVEASIAYGVRPFIGGALPRLGLPGVRFCDGPRGVVVPGHDEAHPGSNVTARAISDGKGTTSSCTPLQTDAR